MASRGTQLFVTPEEFAAWLRDAAQTLGIDVVVEPDSARAPLRAWDGRDETLLRSDRAWLAPSADGVETLTSSGLRPGEFGWVMVDVPKVQDGALLLVQIGAKSEDDQPAAIRLYERFWREWRKRLASPVWARNRVSGAEASYRDVHYSPAAAAWFRGGGKLRQRGVANIEYEIRA